MPTELESWVLLNGISAVGPVKFKILLDYLGSAEKVLSSTFEDLARIEGIGEKTAGTIIDERGKFNLKKEIDETARDGIKIIASFMDEYPASLKTIYDYPPVLYIKGEIREQDAFAVAIIGSRKNTVYGKSACEKIVRDLTDMGVTIISGFARGIDTIAHQTALSENGRTIAVLGNGLSYHYPPENRKMEDKIIANGAIISEFPMGQRPDKQNFPRRNRLISGLSLGVVVVEAAEKSGALITATCASEQGRDVFAVPGSIFSKYSAGPHQLINKGAKLAEKADDIISEISVLKNLVDKTRLNLKVVREEKKISAESRPVYNLIGHEPVHIDYLSEKLNMPIEKLAVILLNLVIDGLISELPGKTYIRKE